MKQLSGHLNYMIIWTGYQVLGNQESMASWEQLSIILVFVCMGLGCLLVVGFLWGFVGAFVCLGVFFSFFC